MYNAKENPNLRIDKRVTLKQPVEDYVFEIDGEDMINVSATYSVCYYVSSKFKDGKKESTSKKPFISIELSGTDKNNNPAFISFDIKTDFNFLSNLDNNPHDITYLLDNGDSFIKRPLEESDLLEFEIPKNNKDDMYKNLSSLWVLKLKKDFYLFKLSVPNYLFTYFVIKYEGE